jgi:fatty acid desaturase
VRWTAERGDPQLARCRAQRAEKKKKEADLEASQDLGATISGGARLVATPDRLGTILKYKADRGPVAYSVAVLILRLAIWSLATPLVCAISVVPLAVLGMFVAPINHHHQHVNSFRKAWLNRLYDVVLALQTGIGPYGWVLHHNLGHHRNYLNQPPHDDPDESRWTRADGTQMGRLEYSVTLLLTHQIDIFRVGRRHPKYLRYYLLMKLPVWGLIGAGLWLRPLETVLVFLLPAFMTLFHTIWATYEHHAGCPQDNHYVASFNRDGRIYNVLTGNLGFHTAHHKRPGLHWSLLPEMHEQIKHQIPEEQILKAFW